MPRRNGHGNPGVAAGAPLAVTEGTLIGWAGVVATVIFATDVLVPQGIAIPMVYVAIVLISLWSDQKRLTLAFAACATLLTSIGYFLSPPGNATLAGINRGLSIVVLAVAAYPIVLIQQARQELHTLRHFLPRCASCRKIRDEHGVWNGMEQFLQERLDLFFTHGMCQICLEKWYPEMYPELQIRHPELFQSQPN